MREIGDNYCLRDCLRDTLRALRDPANEARQGQIAADFMLAYAQELDRAAEADLLLDMLQNPETTDLGFDVVLPEDVLDAAEAKGIDLQSRAVLWEGVAYLHQLNGAG